MDHRQRQHGIKLLLSDRRQDAKLTIPELENSFVWITVIVPDLDAMDPLNGDLFHRVGDRALSVACQPVIAGPDHEMRSGFARRAEQLVDVALAIAPSAPDRIP